MIIFMLTMMNVLVVTNNLISDSASTADTEIRTNQIDRTLRNLISTSGSTNWQNMDSTTLGSLNWTIGLKNQQNDALNDIKLARLKRSNIPEYGLSYDEIGRHLPSQGKVYRLEVFSPLNNSILSLTPVGNDIRIVGRVNIEDEVIQGANITIHLIKLGSSGNATLQTYYSSTNSSGYYNVLATGLLPANYVAAVSFADLFGTMQDTGFAVYQSVGANFQKTNSTIQPSASGSSNTLDLYIEKMTSNALSHVWALYPGGSFGDINQSQISQSTFNSTPATYNIVPSIVLPPTGSVVLFSLQNSSFTTGYYTIDVLPTYLDGDVEPPLTPPSVPNGISSTSTISVLIREIVVYIRLTVWEVNL